MRVYDSEENGYICKAAAQYISDACLDRGFGACQAVGFIRDENLIGGVVYHNYDPEAGTIEISAGIDPAYRLTRGEWQDIFDAPFVKMNCQMFYFKVSKKNKRLRETLKRMGCTEYIIPRMLGRTQAQSILTMSDEAWYASPYSKRPKK